MKFVNALKVAAGGLALACGLAQAAPALYLSDGTAEITVFDNSGADNDATIGVVDWFGAVGAWTIRLSLGYGHDYFGHDALHLTNVELTTSAPSTNLTIKFTDTNFTAPASGSVHWGADVGAGGASAISYGLYVDGSNTAFNTAGPGVTLIGDNSTAAPCGWIASYCFGGDALVSDLYAVTFVAEVSHTETYRQISSLDFNAQVPEPSVLAMLAIGLVGFGAVARRRVK